MKLVEGVTLEEVNKAANEAQQQLNKAGFKIYMSRMISKDPFIMQIGYLAPEEKP